MFPKVYKAGFVLGGGIGDGALQIRGETVQYYRTTSLSYGFQLGVQWRTEIVLFMTQEALDKFRAGNGWQAGIDGSIAVIAFGVGQQHRHRQHPGTHHRVHLRRQGSDVRSVAEGQ